MTCPVDFWDVFWKILCLLRIYKYPLTYLRELDVGRSSVCWPSGRGLFLSFSSFSSRLWEARAVTFCLLGASSAWEGSGKNLEFSFFFHKFWQNHFDAFKHKKIDLFTLDLSKIIFSFQSFFFVLGEWALEMKNMHLLFLINSSYRKNVWVISVTSMSLCRRVEIKLTAPTIDFVNPLQWQQQQEFEVPRRDGKFLHQTFCLWLAERVYMQVPATGSLLALTERKMVADVQMWAESLSNIATIGWGVRRTHIGQAESQHLKMKCATCDGWR